MKTIKRRKKEHKTDYLKRFKMLKSGKPRIVFRKTNKYIIAQYISGEKAQDKILVGINSKILKEYGWTEEMGKSIKSVPASYLTGLLMGKRIYEKNLELPIIDFGMARPTYHGKGYAFIKGLIDAGVGIKTGKDEIFPDEEKISGKGLKKDMSKTFEKIKSKIEK